MHLASNVNFGAVIKLNFDIGERGIGSAGCTVEGQADSFSVGARHIDHGPGGTEIIFSFHFGSETNGTQGIQTVDSKRDLQVEGNKSEINQASSSPETTDAHIVLSGSSREGLVPPAGLSEVDRDAEESSIEQSEGPVESKCSSSILKLTERDGIINEPALEGLSGVTAYEPVLVESPFFPHTQYFQSVTAMSDYESFSFEELRFNDRSNGNVVVPCTTAKSSDFNHLSYEKSADSEAPVARSSSRVFSGCDGEASLDAEPNISGAQCSENSESSRIAKSVRFILSPTDANETVEIPAENVDRPNVQSTREYELEHWGKEKQFESAVTHMSEQAPKVFSTGLWKTSQVNIATADCIPFLKYRHRHQSPNAWLGIFGTWHAPYEAFVDTDSWQYQSISAMNQYRNHSFEELRMQDYVQGSLTGPN
ncbi:hypothetical protein BD410DRAFT_789472 [Rickenella mellea]|uniref:Uncharacterized protein n=1 Tax=Rickenella mellea TaxID=50990 RepID=A0A4Y7Q478_9AGAM|nr:hypothetical protein BD410DRAFT_789472 [Rickenella mellea]